MSTQRWTGVALLLISLGISLGIGIPIGRSIPGGAVDLQVVYYGTRCLLQHDDPYQLSALRDQYVFQQKAVRSVPAESPELVSVYIYLPPTFLIIAPLALLPWSIAKILWMIFLAGTLWVAGVLIAEGGSRYATGVGLFLTCLVLANCEVGLALENSAILVVSLCTIGAWSLLRQRGTSLAVIVFAVALAVKPHDALLICLYFLLAGGAYRRNAARALGLWVVIGIATAMWVSQVAPHWLHEWQANMASEEVHGGMSDPSLDAATGRGAGQVIDLQGALSVLKDEPAFYNPTSYAICGFLTFVWVVATLKGKFSETRAWLALASIVPLTLLVTYHRSYDAKLLLLAIPACALLWRGGGARGWGALTVTTSAIMFTADIPLALLSHATARFDIAKMEMLQRVLMIPVVRPAPIALLVLALFYLWVYVETVRGASVPERDPIGARG